MASTPNYEVMTSTPTNEVMVSTPADEVMASNPNDEGISGFMCGVINLCALLIIAGVITLDILFLLPSGVGQPELSVASASVASFDISGFPPQLSADFNVTLSLHNPSTLFSYPYKGFRAAMMYGTTVLTETSSLPELHQSKRSSTTLRVALAAGADLLESNVAYGMRRDRDTYGAVEFRLDVRARIGGWPWRVNCNDITIWFTDGTGAAGSTVGPPTMCELNRWF